MSDDLPSYDALLLLSFGGPEGPEEVLPFLENVLRGKNVPRERMLAVAEHYQQFGGVSPINQQCRQLITALEADFATHGIDLPIYWGNRNWHPLLPDTLRQMERDGVRRALAFVTSVFSSYSGCRQYLEDIERARATVGPGAPQVDKLRAFYNHPGFITAMRDRVADALNSLTDEARSNAHLVFTAHSIPLAMANGCAYVDQLREACRLVAEPFPDYPWQLVYQSRSGPPNQPWLEPDVCDYLRELRSRHDAVSVVVTPIGFISDHMEVQYDLDTEARQLCEELHIPFCRAKTVGVHPRFVQMIRELVEERRSGGERLYWGHLGPSHDVCPADCCPSGRPKPSASR